MATGASCIPISSSCHGLGAMICCKLGDISTIPDARNNKRKYASSCSWGLRVQTNANVPTKWRMHNHNISHPAMDLNGLGCKVDDDSLFDLTFTVRSYEIGADGKASIQTIMSYFQEAITKILKRIGEIGDGSDSTYKNLTWVLTRIQVIVYRYPTWSDVVRVIKPCLTISGKHSLRWHMLICDCETSEVLVRATRWSDLDFNKHVNNLKYFDWILESVPESLLKNYELASMALTYLKECKKDCILQSFTSVLRSDNDGSNHVDCHHMLQLEEDGSVAVKGWTRWRPKFQKS